MKPSEKQNEDEATREKATRGAQGHVQPGKRGKTTKGGRRRRGQRRTNDNMLNAKETRGLVK